MKSKAYTKRQCMGCKKMLNIEEFTITRRVPRGEQIVIYRTYRCKPCFSKYKQKKKANSKLFSTAHNSTILKLQSLVYKSPGFKDKDTHILLGILIVKIGLEKTKLSKKQIIKGFKFKDEVLKDYDRLLARYEKYSYYFNHNYKRVLKQLDI